MNLQNPVKSVNVADTFHTLFIEAIKQQNAACFNPYFKGLGSS
jgi:hypothetical protein